MSCSWRFWLVFVLFGLPNNPAMAQGDKNHVQVSFDENGKLEQPKDWEIAKNAIVERKPNHVFIIVHGWRTSKADSKEMVEALAALLHAQKDKNESIQVVGVHWPSLLGDNEGKSDRALKELAKLIETNIEQYDPMKVQEFKVKLKNTLNGWFFRGVWARTKIPLLEKDQVDQIVDNLDDVSNIENLLTIFTCYQMKARANLIGRSSGLQKWLTELQDGLPGARFHLVGHSFGCKLCLACLDARTAKHKQVDSVTLLQGAVSTLCFADKLKGLNDTKGAYAEVLKRVKGCICTTHTTQDQVLRWAYYGMSKAAGQVAELKGVHYNPRLGFYAVGDKGIDGVTSIPMLKNGEAYRMRPGLNSVNANLIIRHHGDIRTADVAWLIWSAARQSP